MDLFEFAEIWTLMSTYAHIHCVDISFKSVIGSENIIFYAEEARTNKSKTLIVTCQTFDRVEEPYKLLKNMLKNLIDEVSV